MPQCLQNVCFAVLVLNSYVVSSSLPLTAVALDGRGDRAVATAGDEVQVLDLVTGTVTRRATLGYTLTAAVWTHGGTAVALSGQDFRLGGAGVVDLLDAATLSRRGGAKGRDTAGGGQLRLESGGKRLLTTFRDRVALWDAQSGILLRSLGVEDRTVGGFDPGSTTLVLASSQGAISRWDPQPEAAIAVACRVVGRTITEVEWRAYLPDREPAKVC